MIKFLLLALVTTLSTSSHAQLIYNSLKIKSLNLPSETASKALFLDASKNVDSGTLPRALGGTGLTAAGAIGNVLTSDGTDWVSSAPSTGVTSINAQGGPAVTLAAGSAGTDFAISALTNTITFNIPTSSATNRGLLSTTDWSTFNNKVSGPVSSTDNAIVRWDLATGKIIQDSLVLISDVGAITGVTAFTVDNINIDGNQISSLDANGPITLSPNGTGVIDHLKGSRFRGIDYHDIGADAATGANATLTLPSKRLVRLTGALTSVDMIPAGAEGQLLILENAVGSSITINNDTGATAANRIKTGTGANMTLVNDASVSLAYDNTEARWMVVGGSGSATGSVTSSSGTSTDNHLATFDGASGAIIQDNSTVTLSDAGAMSGLTLFDVDNLRLDLNTLSSTNANGNIIFDPNGTGNINLPDLTASLPLQLDASKNIVSSQVSLTSGVTGVLPIANGGTSSSTALSGSSIMISNGTNIVQGAAGTTTTVLHGNAAGAPTYSAVSLTADVSGVLPFANGGTNKNMTAVNGGVVWTDADSQEVTAAGTSGQYLQSNGAAAPSWVTPSAVPEAYNVRGSEGAGTTTLSYPTDSLNQAFNLSAARTVVLPSTNITAGMKVKIENRGNFLLTVQSSDTTVITFANMSSGSAGAPSIYTGEVELIALQAAPTSPSHWFISSVYEKTNSTVVGTGESAGEDVQLQVARNGRQISASFYFDSNITLAGASLKFAALFPTNFRPITDSVRINLLIYINSGYVTTAGKISTAGELEIYKDATTGAWTAGNTIDGANTAIFGTSFLLF